MSNGHYKSADENPRGLHARYKVEKLYGEDDPNADYFVLRLDKAGDDQVWTAACRAAIRTVADALIRSNAGLSNRNAKACCRHRERASSGRAGGGVTHA